MDWLERLGWIFGATALCVLGIPWFLWGNDTIVAGLPLWIWWHIGWLLLASGLFWLFAQRAWGVGIEPDTAKRGEANVPPGGER
ncbi:DUF3311 domain-containing protein [Halobacteria archaeon AArc-curdl1]|uniref:DUF3311 domain-containing protein n=1 Tax=Natronosalvus hydrolyticus TaxID=2979988 RepID=A0AAP2Z6H1_9EURY|nr:DUF3311 domain-containing protein [Halobacteria archaeon AArc-curdl1]